MSLLVSLHLFGRHSWLALAAGLLTCGQLHAEEMKLSYGRETRPILADNCFACHGPDVHQRKAKLRLDTQTGALAELRSGGHTIVPGKPEESALIERISADDPSQRMPPKKTGKQLTPAQIDLLRRWIVEGAPYRIHWAFVPPTRHALPAVMNPTWPKNAIDYFILARLEREGLQPSPETDRTTLIRRVTLGEASSDGRFTAKAS